MGKDKGLVEYHGIPQREYVYALLNQLCDKVFLSVREQQLHVVPNEFNTIIDQDKFTGPFNGILSAFSAHRNVGWLVLACDLPLMDRETILQLIHARDSGKSATAFKNPETGEPEPLACIWEKKGLEKALVFLQQSDYASPKKFLMQTDIKLVHANRTDALLNANSPSEYAYVKKKLLEQEGG